MKRPVTHMIKQGRTKTLNGMVEAYCMPLDGSINKSSHLKNEVSCKRCLMIRKRIDNLKYVSPE
jgi:hypothetical protein